MKRFTQRMEDGGYLAASGIAEQKETGGFRGEAIDRLARFENLMESLAARQRDIPVTLEKLRGEGREKSYKFREEFAKKLMAEAFLSMMAEHGLKIP